MTDAVEQDAVPPRPRAGIGAVALAALATGAWMLLRPVLETLATLALGSAGDPRYVVAVVGTRSPVLVTVALVTALVMFVAFAAATPLRAGLRMGEVVARGLGAGAVALVLAAVASTVVALMIQVGAVGMSSRGLGSLARSLPAELVGGIVTQLGANLDLLVVVPFAALLLWGAARRRAGV